MLPTRIAAVAAMLIVAITLQVGLFSEFAIAGVVPNLAMLVIIGAALIRGPEYAASLGLVAGLLVDLAPPADHTAGRWALAFVIVGYLAGMVRHDADGSAVAALMAVAGCSFVGSSVFALSGLLLGDAGITIERVFTVVPISVGYDVALAPLVLPPILMAFRGMAPPTLRGALT